MDFDFMSSYHASLATFQLVLDRESSDAFRSDSRIDHAIVQNVVGAEYEANGSVVFRLKVNSLGGAEQSAVAQVFTLADSLEQVNVVLNGGRDVSQRDMLKFARIIAQRFLKAKLITYNGFSNYNLVSTTLRFTPEWAPSAATRNAAVIDSCILKPQLRQAIPSDELEFKETRHDVRFKTKYENEEVEVGIALKSGIAHVRSALSADKIQEVYERYVREAVGAARK